MLKQFYLLIKKYKIWVTSHIVSNILTALFTVLSLPIVIPIFNLFLSDEEVVIPTRPSGLSFGTLDDFAQFYLFEWIMDGASKNQALIKACILLVIVFFLKNLFTYLSLFFMSPVRNGIIRDLREQMYNKISYLPLAFFSDEKKGDIIARMSADVLEVEWSILTTLEKIIRDPLIIIGSIGFMLLVSPRLTLFVAIMLVLTGLIIGGISKQLKKQSGEVQSTLGKILVMVEETLGGLKVVKAFNAEKMVNSRFAKENNHYRQMYTKLLWRRDLASPLSEFLGIVAVCVLFVYGAKLVMNSQMGSEVFMAFLLAFFYTINPAKSISSAYYNFQKGSAAMDRINMILKEKNPIREISGEASLNTFKDKIEFKDVNFSYNTNTPLVLKNISFDVNKNKTIALVGASGSGKSTIASLLLRLYDVSEGKIKIDGLEIDQIKLDELRQLFGLVTQDPILFNTTIAENISFGTGITDMKRIADAARIANAHEFIEQMPEGYETMAGDSGQKLSGGQKQRIALARAILADPPILILDEATSALDSRSESLVQDALEKILKDRTAIVIAHRLSTIQRSDKILVLRDGEIIEEGKHEELLSRRGEYSKFVELQRM